MKNFYRVFIITLLLISLLTTSVFILAACKDKEPPECEGTPVDNVSPTVNFYRPEGDLPYLTKTNADGSQCEEDFKIVTFTDPHFYGEKSYSGDAVSLTLIENTIKLEKPDLVVMLGDNCVGANAAQAINNLGELFKKYNQYWGYVLGNHDGEHKDGPARSTLAALYGKFEHCIITPAEGIFGYCNSIINIKKVTGEVIQSLVFIDTGNFLIEDYCIEYGFKYNDSLKAKYDFIKRDQIDWYKETMYSVSEKNGGYMPDSIMFMHLPLNEYKEAFYEAEEKGEIIRGNRQEPITTSPFNTGMFDAILEVGSTKAVVAGHNHNNDFMVNYRGVKLLHSQTTSFNTSIIRKREQHVASYVANGYLENGAYFSDGHTEFSISLSGELKITPRLNQDNPALFNGLSEKQRKEQNLDRTLPKQG